MAKKGRSPKKRDPNNAIIAQHKRASHDFDLGDRWECGIVLRGSEVKSMRESTVRVAESFARIKNNELWLYNLHVAPYSHSGSAFVHEPERPKKLLVHRAEINRIRVATDSNGLTLIPTRLYFKDGRVKIEIAAGRRKKQHDKRRDIAAREADREAARAMGTKRG